MRFAYADPPYLGMGRKLYAQHHPDAAKWDSLDAHAELIAQLTQDFPEGWALSCSTPSLRHLLPLCPADVRIAAWVKPFHVFKKGVRPAYAWEPVLFRGGRNKNHPPPPKGGKATTPKDFVAANITLRRGLTGAKPDPFCFWLFDLLGAKADDEFHDLFPGSGAVSRAWEQWKEHPRMSGDAWVDKLLSSLREAAMHLAEARQQVYRQREKAESRIEHAQRCVDDAIAVVDRTDQPGDAERQAATLRELADEMYSYVDYVITLNAIADRLSSAPPRMPKEQNDAD